MIRSIRIRLAAVFLLACAVAPAAAAPSGVEQVDLAWKKAIVSNDVEAVMACYAPDAVAWLPDMPEARGATAIREAYKQFLGANTIKEATFFETNYEIHGDRATGWGHFSLTFVPKTGDAAGKPVTMKGRYSEVGVKREGKWVYLVDHASAEPAPAVGMPAK